MTIPTIPFHVDYYSRTLPLMRLMRNSPSSIPTTQTSSLGCCLRMSNTTNARTSDEYELRQPSFLAVHV